MGEAIDVASPFNTTQKNNAVLGFRQLMDVPWAGRGEVLPASGRSALDFVFAVEPITDICPINYGAG